MTNCRWKESRVCPTPAVIRIKDRDDRDAECMICAFTDILEIKEEEEG